MIDRLGWTPWPDRSARELMAKLVGAADPAVLAPFDIHARVATLPFYRHWRLVVLSSTYREPGQNVAMEVKADAAPGPDAPRHLATLRDRYDADFVAGIVFHTGPRTYRLGDRLVAAPISVLWG